MGVGGQPLRLRAAGKGDAMRNHCFGQHAWGAKQTPCIARMIYPVEDGHFVLWRIASVSVIEAMPSFCWVGGSVAGWVAGRLLGWVGRWLGARAAGLSVGGPVGWVGDRSLGRFCGWGRLPIAQSVGVFPCVS